MIETPLAAPPPSPFTSLRRPSAGLARAAYGALAAVLVFLAGFALWAAVTTHQAADHAERASILSDQYQQARYWIGAEESLERKYGLEGGADVLAAHHATAH
jgi:hypothetical protein